MQITEYRFTSAPPRASISRGSPSPPRVIPDSPPRDRTFTRKLCAAAARRTLRVGIPILYSSK